MTDETTGKTHTPVIPIDGDGNPRLSSLIRIEAEVWATVNHQAQHCADIQSIGELAQEHEDALEMLAEAMVLVIRRTEKNARAFTAIKLLIEYTGILEDQLTQSRAQDTILSDRIDMMAEHMAGMDERLRHAENDISGVQTRQGTLEERFDSRNVPL